MRNDQRFTPSVIENEVNRRLGSRSSDYLVRLMSYHICVKLNYSKNKMANRFYCLPSMIHTIDSELNRIYNDLLFCFDVHECQANTPV